MEDTNEAGRIRRSGEKIFDTAPDMIRTIAEKLANGEELTPEEEKVADALVEQLNETLGVEDECPQDQNPKRNRKSRGRG